MSTLRLNDILREYSDIGKYLEYLVNVIRSLGTSNFEENLMVFLSKIVPIDHCAVFTYSNKGEAGHLFTHSKMPDRESEKLARDYVEKFHKQDPNFGLMKELEKEDYHRFSRQDLKKDYDPAYQNHFFNRSGLIDKAASIGKIEDGRVYCNFYRMKHSSTYSREEWKMLKKLMPLATALIASHFELAKLKGVAFLDNGSENIVNKSIVHNVISNDMPPFDRLTLRERQVCERILLGYTTTGIGLDLDIAPSSVATYRKRAYAKLDISSQNELFKLCLRLKQN